MQLCGARHSRRSTCEARRAALRSEMLEEGEKLDTLDDMMGARRGLGSFSRCKLADCES